MKQSSYQRNYFGKSSTFLSLVVAVIFGTASITANAQEHDTKSSATHPDHIMVKPENVKWMDGPPSLPPGAKFAVIEGDPKVSGLFTMRLWFPAGYKIAAHSHPADEHITVISGTFLMGLGDNFVSEKLQPLPVGSFGVMLTGTKHFAMTKEETVVQLHGVGPWGINYVNPADDPRKK
jgi:quercetin dioxygenase-like cupin family protein